mgnify:CR=1 FL=1
MNITKEDIFIKKAVKTASVYKPDGEFTNSLMDKIQSLSAEKNKAIITSPLISIAGWVIITSITIAIFSILLLSSPSNINFSFLTDYFHKFESIRFSITISKVFLTGLTAFVFFFIIEISLISRKINGIKEV